MATGTSTNAGRRQRRARTGCAGASAMRATRWTSATGGCGRAPRSSRTRSAKRGSRSGKDIVCHLFLELCECPREAGRAGRLGDPEQAGSLLGVEVEDDAEGDDLAVGRRELAEGALECG